MAKTCAAQEIGADACWLVTVVAHQEDTKFYTGPVTYWNEQLMPLCGFNSRKSIVKARTKAIQAGWLHYEPGTKGKAGKYWTTIPDQFASIPDTPIGESVEDEFRVKKGTQSGTESRATTIIQGQKGNTIGNGIGNGMGNGMGTPSYPSPNPSPNPNTNTPPAAVGRKRPDVYSEDFERFWKAYPAIRKTAKGKTAKAFEVALKRVDAETILSAVVEYANSPIGSGQYCKAPTTWLNGRCWDDDRAAWNGHRNGTPNVPMLEVTDGSDK